VSRLAEIVAARRDRRRALREELVPLAQDVATPEMQRLGYVEGLHEERRALEQRLRRAEALAPDEKVEVPLTPPHQWPTAISLTRDLRARLECINAEIARAEAG